MTKHFHMLPHYQILPISLQTHLQICNMTWVEQCIHIVRFRHFTAKTPIPYPTLEG